MAVRNRDKRLVIDFRTYLPDGRRVRCVEAEGPDNQRNRQRVTAKCKAVKYALDAGKFNYLEHFPHGSKAKYFKVMSGMLFSKWWGAWFAEKSIAYGTAYNYRLQYEKLFGPRFGHVALQDIGRHEVIVFRRELEEKGLMAITINVYMRTLCQCLLAAHKRGLAPEYACDGRPSRTSTRSPSRSSGTGSRS